jgi:hypothetical protein
MLTFPSGIAPSLAAAQLFQQVNGVLTQVSGALNNGIPARGNIPAVAAVDLQNAIGSDNFTKLANAMAALA